MSQGSRPARKEFGGIIRHGAKTPVCLRRGYRPKITVITRKAYGGAYCVMGSKHLRTDVNFAYPPLRSPSWERKAPSTSCTPRARRRAGSGPGARAKTAEFRERFANPFHRRERGFVTT